MTKLLAVLTLIVCGALLVSMLSTAPIVTGGPPVTGSESKVNLTIAVILSVAMALAITELRPRKE